MEKPIVKIELVVYDVQYRIPKLVSDAIRKAKLEILRELLDEGYFDDNFLETHTNSKEIAPDPHFIHITFLR